MIIMVGLDDCAKRIIDVVLLCSKNIFFATGAQKDYNPLITREHVKIKEFVEKS